MRESSKKVLLNYLDMREEHNLRNKIAFIIGRDIVKYSGEEGWNHRIAQKITRMIRNRYLFMIERF